MEKWKKILKYPLIWLFALFIFGFALWDILTPSREFSEMENRMLQQNPPFSLKSLMAKGEQAYTRKYEKYINDQFVLRDGWITLKSYGESALGKIENNNVAFGKDGYLFEKVFSVDEENLSANLKYMEEFLDKYPSLPVTFSVIPNAYTILTEKLPAGFSAVSVDQNRRIEELYSRLEGAEGASKLKLLRLSPVLSDHQEEYIYYRTDHHWTTYGAYLAYGEYVRSLGMEPVDWEKLEPHEVEGFYGSFDAKAKKAGTLPDVITWFDIPCRVDSFPMNTVDLARILGIFLDNAIEAAPLAEQPQAGLNIIRHEAGVSITISNSFQDQGAVLHKLKQKGFTTKTGHQGIGLSNARKIISSYDNALLETSMQNGRFTQHLELTDRKE